MIVKSGRNGFTIVELLIVIVVIGILAAISIVAYSGIQDRAKRSQVASSASQVAKKVRMYYAEYNSYPVALADIGITSPDGITYDYTKTDNWFCVAAKTTSGSVIAAGSGSDGNCSQVTASYFNNGTLSGNPVLTRIEPNVDSNWGTGSPGPGVPADTFSAVWTGFLTAPVTDTYTIYLYYDDRLRLYLDDVLVADHWATGCCVWRSLTYSFTAGQRLPFKLEMSEGGGGAAARIQWSYTGQTQVAVPPSAFSSE